MQLIIEIRELEGRIFVNSSTSDSQERKGAMKKYIQPYANRTSMRHRVNAIIAVLLSVVMIIGMASGIVPAILPILKHAQAAE